MPLTPEERKELAHDLAEAMKEVGSAQPLSDEEVQWVRLAIQKQIESAAFRKAIITKSLGGVAWLLLAGLGYIILDWAEAHGFRFRQ